MQMYRTVGLFLLAGLLSLFISVQLLTASGDEPTADSRCPVCGMFVAKYPNWLARIRLENGSVQWFDGVKDLMVYYFDPEQYGGAKQDAIKDITVRDYYSLEMIDGRSAFYVVGSDVFGPMGKEFIPFSTKAAAENFLKDHKGIEILEFNAITDERVNEMRTGTRMKHGM